MSVIRKRPENKTAGVVRLLAHLTPALYVLRWEAEIAAENIPLEIMYEDEHIVVVNKPAGMVVHPAAGNYSGPLVNPAPHVTLYTASVCPFCPIMRRRLAELQRHNRFEVQEIDVTFRPEIVRAKGLRSVPVLEDNGQFLVGNAPSAQISQFLSVSGTVSDRLSNTAIEPTASL